MCGLGGADVTPGQLVGQGIHERAIHGPLFFEYGVWIILGKGLLPIPYKLITIASGAAHFDLFTFVWVSALTRGVRFFAVAALLWKYGEAIREFIEKRLTLVAALFVITLVGGFVAVRFLF